MPGETPEQQAICRKAHDLLRGLGGSEKEIAESLAEQGVQGEVGSSETCVIAEYLAEKLGRDHRVSVYASLVNVDDCQLTSDNNDETHKLPPEFYQFILKFDDGGYPKLATAVCTCCGKGVGEPRLCEDCEERDPDDEFDNADEDS